ncbi:hypothetical protein HZI73_22440 [Vallitalea pronyensis]|uniref:Uncharacterized protein n=1 Tax=Vallitalea pronyensis TaxID=1348613 RepID=A0A8J8MNV4_9FIRM|nr:hypothetical protein [Vallitalea pronyensis]QUI24889.1 hypothetical protein HZI73_22440 [Vallitalea pronyensis]
MSKFDNKWCVSGDKEHFDAAFDTKEEAIQEGKALEYDTIYIGKCVDDFAPHIDADDVIERLQCEACDVGGEYGESYLEDVTKEQEEELEEQLNDVLSEWLTKYKHEVNFYSVENVERIQG